MAIDANAFNRLLHPERGNDACGHTRELTLLHGRVRQLEALLADLTETRQVRLQKPISEARREANRKAGRARARSAERWPDGTYASYEDLLDLK